MDELDSRPFDFGPGASGMALLTFIAAGWAAKHSPDFWSGVVNVLAALGAGIALNAALATAVGLYLLVYLPRKRAQARARLRVIVPSRAGLAEEVQHGRIPEGGGAEALGRPAPILQLPPREVR